MGKKGIPKTSVNSLTEECIRVQKVYDWITDTFSVTKNICFSQEQLRKIEEALEDPCRRPLRLQCQTPASSGHYAHGEEYYSEKDIFFCEQIGDKRDVTVPLNGSFVDAQLVDLLFTTGIKVQVVDRRGKVVTCLTTDASVLEPFVLCYPEGTDLFCRVTRVLCKIPTGSVLLNCPAPNNFQVVVTFCVDIQIEAEVKLEVLAKFCTPRENDLQAEEFEDICPSPDFPQQCPDIFPRAGCDCSTSGEASGCTGSKASEKGKLGVYADICRNCALSESSLRFTFEDENGGLNNFNFVADTFQQDSLCCEIQDGRSMKFLVSGTGNTDDGEEYDFNFAAVDSKGGSCFQLQLCDKRGVVVFESGIVQVEEGSLEVEYCVSFDDLRLR
ncbi:hypothetical protein A374_14950 [Fictibacillus macauensis ZFHKF-1]|uniref:Uncharacterized protein n=1 Tax=Fictibacillus macauensis ZFHKF-1 TaxID=1196324 RepID=I8IYT2_9BACL|nr:hypothetical protein [Fictibacillus macauensis]EIT84636.1 hypothetical protein A374_14950 [Fictibacillus macauensis ZFHKF-1]